MSPALYAFLLASGSTGVSRPAILRWARTHGTTADAALMALRRAVRRGELAKRAGGPSRGARIIVYYVPTQWHRERSA
jgi:hypothetical protein